MNFEEIKKKYPKAYAKLTSDGDYSVSLDINGDYSLFLWVEHYCYPYTLRDLYDFFDMQGLRIAITIDNQFGYEIYTNGFDDIGYQNIGWFDKRNECEEEAFIKAFELLENK